MWTTIPRVPAVLLTSAQAPEPLRRSMRLNEPEIGNFFASLRDVYAVCDIHTFVRHSSTVPALIKALGQPRQIKTPETEYDNLIWSLQRAKVLLSLMSMV
jgi:hypothetical protein